MDGAERIAAERRRQIEVEGWTAEHDARHVDEGSGSEALAWAAICYATPPEDRQVGVPKEWPWARRWWKPTDDRVRELEKAGALIAAEIDRLVGGSADE